MYFLNPVFASLAVVAAIILAIAAITIVIFYVVFRSFETTQTPNNTSTNESNQTSSEMSPETSSSMAPEMSSSMPVTTSSSAPCPHLCTNVKSVYLCSNPSDFINGYKLFFAVDNDRFNYQFYRKIYDFCADSNVYTVPVTDHIFSSPANQNQPALEVVDRNIEGFGTDVVPSQNLYPFSFVSQPQNGDPCCSNDKPLTKYFAQWTDVNYNVDRLYQFPADTDFDPIAFPIFGGTISFTITPVQNQYGFSPCV